MTVKSLASSGQNYEGAAVDSTPLWQTARDDKYHIYRKLWSERPLKKEPGAFPLHLDLETTNLCNIKCIMCPRTRYLERGDRRWSPRGLGRMGFDLYKNLIGQAAAGGAYSVKLNLLGEPMLHPDVVKQVAWAHRSGLYVMINTNATLLTADMSRLLLTAGLDDIFFSLDSPYKGKFERIRPGAHFETVLENTKKFVEIKDSLGLIHVQTRASMTTDILGRTSFKEKEDFRSLLKSLGVEEVGFGPADDHMTDHSESNLKNKTDFFCEQIYQRLFVTWDGVITPCCGHWERRYPIGSVNEISLKSAWHSRPYQLLRQAHEQNRYTDINICRRCSVPHLNRIFNGKNDQ